MRFVLVLLLFIMGSLPQITGAESEGVLNKLLAPGPLIGGHHDLEKASCFKCHDAGKGVPVAKCLECHKEIKHYVELKKGFHGINTQNCTECHSDHKGRDYDSISFDINSFDHGKSTGYYLEGKHAQLRCDDCHKEKRTKKYLNPQDTHYFGAASSCKSCHRKDDVHFFTGKYAKQDCNACHNLKAWKQDLRFNHDRDTHFKLQERHAELKCNDCHAVDQRRKIFKYTWPQMNRQQCLSCHQDFHRKTLSAKFQGGGSCVKCHTQTNWKIQNFNHAITSYKLNGKHAELQCIDCHKQGKGSAPTVSIRSSTLPKLSRTLAVKNMKWTGLGKACLSCHQDFHKFGNIKSKRYGDMNQCLKCHDEASWKKTHDFSHDIHTRYRIDGKHSDLKCTDCHLPHQKKNPTRMPSARQGVYHWLQLENKTCENCHANPHLKQFKPALLKQKCTSCHITDGWAAMKSDKGFDHNKTRFALTGAHTSISCNECHSIKGKKVYKFASVDKKFCIDCHKNVHVGQFSAKFASTNCTECHTTKTFVERLNFDHNKTAYKLEGSHAKLNCADCHKATTAKFNLSVPNISKKDFKSQSRNPAMGQFRFPDLQNKKCQTCHEDYHKGQLGNSCQDCHSVSTWKKLDFNHDLQTKFPLEDKHANVKCSDCHTPVQNQFITYKNQKRPLVRYKPLGQRCIDCHIDHHMGEFGTNCSECHTVRGWRATRDFHKNFTLTGVHFTLECTECHESGRNRKLSGLSQNCLFCHQKDDAHNGTQPNCKDCHTQNFWEFTSFKHSLTRFPLRGMHRTLDCIECHNRGGAQTMYQGLSSDCASCHDKDARAATSFDHVTSGNLTNCTQCHRNQFSFQGR